MGAAPLAFVCPQARRRRDWKTGSLPGGHEIHRTGQSRPNRSHKRGPRTLDSEYQYECLCGHVGWTRHSDILAGRYAPQVHGSYNGWCRVEGIPLKATDCPRCVEFERVRGEQVCLECGHQRRLHVAVDYGNSTRGIVCSPRFPDDDLGDCICRAPTYDESTYGGNV